MMTEDKVLEMVSKAQEFEQIKVRETVLKPFTATALRRCLLYRFTSTQDFFKNGHSNGVKQCEMTVAKCLLYELL